MVQEDDGEELPPRQMFNSGDGCACSFEVIAVGVETLGKFTPDIGQVIQPQLR